MRKPPYKFIKRIPLPSVPLIPDRDTDTVKDGVRGTHLSSFPSVLASALLGGPGLDENPSSP